MGEQTASNLVKLSRSDLMIDDPGDDVRGRHVVTVGGEKIGEVDDLQIDPAQGRVRFLEVGTDGFPQVDLADRYVNSIYGYYGYSPPFVPGAETL